MKKLKLMLLVCCGFAMFGACTNTGVTIDPTQQQAMVDSLVTAKSEALKDSMATVCETRLAEEVVAKADSVLQAGEAEPEL